MSAPDCAGRNGAHMAGRRRPKERKGETVGGGYFVFRRGKWTGRVGVRTTLPFEHGSYDEAIAEARRLSRKHPGETFEVFATTGDVAFTALRAISRAEGR